MQRLSLALALLGSSSGFVTAEAPLVVSPDVPTKEAASLNTLQPHQAFGYDVPASYSLLVSIPGEPTLDGLQKMDRAGHWLFSIETADDLGGAFGGIYAKPFDVLRFDEGSGTLSFFFCGAAIGLAEGTNVDALYLRGGDASDLLVSFDVPVHFGPFTFEPSDLARFERTGTTCGAWTLAATNPDFDASAAGLGIATSTNVIAAEQVAHLRLLAFDVPVELGPPGVTMFVPGQVVSWDGASFALFEPLAGWPISSLIDGLSSIGNPGMIPATLRLAKTASPQFDTDAVELSWTPSCSAGALYYAIYEGTLGAWYSHTVNDCSDDFVPFTETVAPTAGDRYFLVVAHNGMVEGSYGTSRNFPPGFDTERPVGAALCADPQVITPCP